MTKQIKDLTKGNVKKLLIKLTLPMIFGILGMSIFNLVDTYYVGRLGLDALAALSFTFPIIMVLNGLIQGIGTGVTALVSKTVSQGDDAKLKALIFHSLSLALFISILFMLIGFLSLNSVINWLGAEADIIPLIKSYMHIWLLGLPVVVFPMVGNGIIRSLGNTKTPGIVMLIAAIINILVDPLLIFGLWIFPELGVAGAAIATVFSRSITLVVALYVLCHKMKILTLRGHNHSRAKKNIKDILFVGLPAGLSRIIIPLGMGIITSFIAGYGTAYVAGYGVATKIETFMLIIVNALGATLIPFAGQNIGAGKIDRLRLMRKYSVRFDIIFQLSLYIVLFFTAPYITRIFNQDPNTWQIATMYIKIVSFAYVFKAIILQDVSFLNVMKKPFEAALINLIQVYALFIPLSIWLKSLFGAAGIFWAFSISLILTAIISTWRVKTNFNALDKKSNNTII